MKLKASFALLACVILVGCAVQKHASTLDSETVWRLNTASQLDQLQRDYKTLFTDVGNAHRSGLLSDADVAKLNTIGDKLKPMIEQADQAFKVYQANPVTDKKQQVIALILAAEQVMIDLTAAKANPSLATQTQTVGAH
jgi:hypothetical protein